MPKLKHNTTIIIRPPQRKSYVLLLCSFPFLFCTVLLIFELADYWGRNALPTVSSTRHSPA